MSGGGMLEWVVIFFPLKPSMTGNKMALSIGGHQTI